MALYGAFDVKNLFAELADAREINGAYQTAATQRATAVSNISGVTAGTVTAGQLLMVDANKDVATLREVTAANLILTGAGSGDHAINLDAITLTADKGAIHVGSYSSPVALADTTNLLIQFHAESAGNDAGGFDYTLFTSLKSGGGDDNMIGIHNTCQLVSGADPKTVQAIQGHCYVPSGASLATRGGDLTAGMYGAWFKVYSDVGSTLDSGSYAAPIWIDLQLNGTKNGTTYGIFAKSGATSTALIGVGSDAAGFTNFITFEGTHTPPCYSGDKSGGVKNSYLLIDMNGTAKAIQLYDV